MCFFIEVKKMIFFSMFVIGAGVDFFLENYARYAENAQNTNN